MIEHASMQVQSRGRLYTSTRQRRNLDLPQNPVVEGTSGGVTPRVEAGETASLNTRRVPGAGTPLSVGIIAVERDHEWGTYAQTATFTAPLQYYGEIQIPQPVQDQLDLTEGETVRVTVQVGSN